ncbi:hypothetical protein FACS1894147_09010 [Spirochaetia bacterium]|nr:hypothetical protein FACS1894147_09010 [Spirochaetia bacterium]
MAFCPNCGNKLDDNSRFCTQCGKPTGTPSVYQSPPPQQSVYNQPEVVVHHTAKKGQDASAGFGRGFGETMGKMVAKLVAIVVITGLAIGILLAVLSSL